MADNPRTKPTFDERCNRCADKIVDKLYRVIIDRMSINEEGAFVIEYRVTRFLCETHITVLEGTMRPRYE